MQANNRYPKGLTKIIFEAMVEMIPEMAAQDAKWDKRMLDELEKRLRSRLAPPIESGDGIVFELVFSRAFKEATRLFMENKDWYSYLPATDKAHISPFSRPSF